ncbi:glutathione S-transferase family protein [Minwuia thermotolerans]|uniref:Glutathione S-transferase n=1 Tax=Minwuia thermotolerans TaxID=2056226 RepID=A0A2M9FWW0_9PROT|nr:glutathione S-transferase family protein [Minwuia thermotolerans]PJK27950.1 glutathione S-transferase [Minwuia thermotolerans]
MQFYDCATAPSPRRARIFIAEKGLDVPTTQVDVGKAEQLGDDFLKINPRGTVPVLMTDEGVALTENLAIAAYLEAKHPEPVLMGNSDIERAEVLQWAAIAESHGFQAVAEALRNTNPHMKGRALPGPDNYDQIPELGERGLTRTKRYFEILDRRLEGREWLVGGGLTYADITAFVCADFARIIKMRVPEELGNLHGWYTKMKERPSAGL